MLPAGQRRLRPRVTRPRAQTAEGAVARTEEQARRGASKAPISQASTASLGKLVLSMAGDLNAAIGVVFNSAATIIINFSITLGNKIRTLPQQN